MTNFYGMSKFFPLQKAKPEDYPIVMLAIGYNRFAGRTVLPAGLEIKHPLHTPLEGITPPVYKNMDQYLLSHFKNSPGPGKTYKAPPLPCWHKTSFANEHTADIYLKQLQRTSKRKKKPTASYLCPHCLAWHLTSKHQVNLETQLLQKNQQITHLKSKVKDLKFDLSDAKRRIAELGGEFKRKYPDKETLHPPSG